MKEPDLRSLRIFVGHVCQDEDPALLMRVLVGQTPRDTSPDDGHVIKLDRETGCDLAASGQAVPVCHRGVGNCWRGSTSQTAPATSSRTGEIWRKTRKG